jgi:anti-sigma regulatory factor (Ser/Thr protein kinase)
VSAFLLAEELIDQQEAIDAHDAVAAGGLTDLLWDAQGDASEGDYFSQERAVIADQARLGGISAVQAANLREVLSRIQNATHSDRHSPWHPGQFRKRFPSTDLAPGLARAALATTAIGIPIGDFDTAELLISELVTNACKHSSSDWVEIAITLEDEALRIEVSDQDPASIRPRTPDINGGWGLTLVGELATRWGVERRRPGKMIWIEIDLTPRI